MVSANTIAKSAAAAGLGGIAATGGAGGLKMYLGGKNTPGTVMKGRRSGRQELLVSRSSPEFRLGPAHTGTQPSLQPVADCAGTPNGTPLAHRASFMAPEPGRKTVEEEFPLKHAKQFINWLNKQDESSAFRTRWRYNAEQAAAENGGFTGAPIEKIHEPTVNYKEKVNFSAGHYKLTGDSGTKFFMKQVNYGLHGDTKERLHEMRHGEEGEIRNTLRIQERLKKSGLMAKDSCDFSEGCPCHHSASDFGQYGLSAEAGRSESKAEVAVCPFGGHHKTRVDMPELVKFWRNVKQGPEGDSVYDYLLFEMIEEIDNTGFARRQKEREVREKEGNVAGDEGGDQLARWTDIVVGKGKSGYVPEDRVHAMVMQKIVMKECGFMPTDTQLATVEHVTTDDRESGIKRVVAVDFGSVLWWEDATRWRDYFDDLPRPKELSRWAHADAVATALFQKEGEAGLVTPDNVKTLPAPENDTDSSPDTSVPFWLRNGSPSSTPPTSHCGSTAKSTPGSTGNSFARMKLAFGGDDDDSSSCNDSAGASPQRVSEEMGLPSSAQRRPRSSPQTPRSIAGPARRRRTGLFWGLDSPDLGPGREAART